ncbi:hypothetical protein P7K49_027714 [Saguinus oedipus]|uniref:Uncharacterized protein n=1 Tax=Saguinus oedipus TaxID=9490 RepID=A0ABQ9UAF8_SAGOE|nr:hypothetical protein P7K49_027714 [Saguinus oedipus]
MPALLCENGAEVEDAKRTNENEQLGTTRLTQYFRTYISIFTMTVLANSREEDVPKWSRETASSLCLRGLGGPETTNQKEKEEKKAGTKELLQDSPKLPSKQILKSSIRNPCPLVSGSGGPTDLANACHSTLPQLSHPKHAPHPEWEQMQKIWETEQTNFGRYPCLRFTTEER